MNHPADGDLRGPVDVSHRRRRRSATEVRRATMRAIGRGTWFGIVAGVVGAIGAVVLAPLFIDENSGGSPPIGLAVLAGVVGAALVCGGVGYLVGAWMSVQRQLAGWQRMGAMLLACVALVVEVVVVGGALLSPLLL